MVNNFKPRTFLHLKARHKLSQSSHITKLAAYENIDSLGAI